MGKKLDLVGQRFGRLVVLEEAGRSQTGRIYWKCQCNCGNIKTIRGASLRCKDTQSCGCLKKEKAGKSAKTHGMTGTTEHNAWRNIISRCNNSKNPEYHNYGGRGIKVCEQWLKFETFFADMGRKPVKLTIERIDNNKGYCKENCKWASCATQAKNRRVRATSKTGVIGVQWEKRRKKYVTRISTNHKTYFIGSFTTLADAKNARLNAEQKYWRE